MSIADKYEVKGGKVYNKSGKPLKPTSSGKYRVNVDGKQKTLSVTEILSLITNSPSNILLYELTEKTEDDKAKEKTEDGKAKENPPIRIEKKKIGEEKPKQNSLTDMLRKSKKSAEKMILTDVLSRNYKHVTYLASVGAASMLFTNAYIENECVRRLYFAFIIKSIIEEKLVATFESIIDTSNEEEMDAYIYVSEEVLARNIEEVYDECLQNVNELSERNGILITEKEIVKTLESFL